MREKPRDPAQLEHILRAINNIQRFIEGKTKDDLSDDSILYFALVKNIEIIGEAVYMLTDEFKQTHIQTPWKQIAGMRHVLVHDYYRISPSEVWGVAKNRLNPLKEQITEYIQEFD